MRIPGRLFWDQPIVYIVNGYSGECLYVGMSTRGLARVGSNQVLRENSQLLNEVRILRCSSRIEARQLELKTIRKLKPKLLKLRHRRHNLYGFSMVDRYGTWRRNVKV